MKMLILFITVQRNCGEFYFPLYTFTGFPGGSDSKKICLQCRRPGYDPWVRKIPWIREWQPTPVFLPGKFHGQRGLLDYSQGDRKELHMTERLTLSLYTFMCYLNVLKLAH